MTPEQREINDEENKALLLRVNRLLQQCIALMICIPIEDNIDDFAQTQAVHTNVLSLATLLDNRSKTCTELLPDSGLQVTHIELFAAASSFDTLVSARSVLNTLPDSTQLYYSTLAARLNRILKKRSLLDTLDKQVQ